MATPPVFTSGSVLTAAQMNAVGLWRITTCTVTSVGGTSATASNGVITIGNGNTSVTISNAFSADFGNYLVLVNGCQASQNDQLQLRFGARTTGYKWGLVYNAYNNTPSSLGNGNDTYIKYVQGFTSTAKFDAIIPIRSPYLAAPTIVGPCGYSDTGANGASNAYDDSTTQYTSFILSPASGTLTGGTIRVYGYRN